MAGVCGPNSGNDRSNIGLMPLAGLEGATLIVGWDGRPTADCARAVIKLFFGTTGDGQLP